jgi:hypothetical protein
VGLTVYNVLYGVISKAIELVLIATAKISNPTTTNVLMTEAVVDYAAEHMVCHEFGVCMQNGLEQLKCIEFLSVSVYGHNVISKKEV